VEDFRERMKEAISDPNIMDQDASTMSAKLTAMIEAVKAKDEAKIRQLLMEK
jgi:hypothetical protein